MNSIDRQLATAYMEVVVQIDQEEEKNPLIEKSIEGIKTSLSSQVVLDEDWKKVLAGIAGGGLVGGIKSMFGGIKNAVGKMFGGGGGGGEQSSKGALTGLSGDDYKDLAFIVSAEARRGTEDEYGVAANVLNRVADPRYPNTIKANPTKTPGIMLCLL